jgi:hypothetical protein
MKWVLAFLISVLMFPFQANAAIDKGYLGFAVFSGDGPIEKKSCRFYGGQPIVDQHYNVVMRMGRRDPKRSNVIYHGGHQYVTFSMQTETFWGRKETFVALCHFSG